jgi:hypothetical protein
LLKLAAVFVSFPAGQEEVGVKKLLCVQGKLHLAQSCMACTYTPWLHLLFVIWVILL